MMMTAKIDTNQEIVMLLMTMPIDKNGDDDDQLIAGHWQGKR